MTKWEYCEVHWHQQGVTVTMPQPSGKHVVQQSGTSEWHNVLARLGAEGWELVNVIGPDYWYYFKRPLNA
jgi:hypothetical protein